MDWLSIFLLVVQYGPEFIAWAKSLVEAIREKNPDKGKAAVSQAAGMAADIVRSLRARNDLTNDEKREQAWKDLIAGMDILGVKLSETNARTLTQASYQAVSGK